MTPPATRRGTDAPAALAPALAAALVFGASGAVLMLEILAVRLLAPYVGVTIETYTAIIGVVLAGIAAGSAAGGVLADRVDPRRVLGPLLVVGGLLGMATVPLVEALGSAGASRQGDALFIALIAFLPPAAVLSAVTPTTAKLQLGDLRQTGAVVGRLSAWATAGALVGTFLAGFVLVPLLATRTSVLAIGGALVVAGVAAMLRLGTGRAGAAAAAAVVALGLAGTGVAAGSPCDAETTYHCARIVPDADRPGGRLLVLDDLRHSYVDVDDPTHLEFDYVRWIGAAVDAAHQPPDAIDAVFVGGGALTLPRWLATTRPGSRSTVLEVDERLVAFVRRRLGLPPARVVLGDARTSIDDLPTGSADVLVGDAFGGRAVPWHLTTVEFHREIRRVLRRDGIYTLNVIDQGPLRLARAEAATLRRVFGHVALIAHRGPGGGVGGGNLVFLASDRPLPLREIAARLDPAAERLHAGAAVARFARGAEPLTDDFAPADQLLSTAG